MRLVDARQTLRVNSRPELQTRVTRLRLNGNRNHKNSLAPSRRLGLALLFFVAHAFLASATHFHRSQAADLTPPQHNLSASQQTDTDASADSNTHAQCPLCRLQRNLVADLDAPRQPVAGLLPDSTRALSRPAVIPSNRAFLSPSGRAPPLA
ncbi:MAG TPA: DUF2946 family protein [Pyrinomonadaceae bacterium]|nr:DUF2946 family protein [Pyrinomonadaceae bacterium]